MATRSLGVSRYGSILLAACAAVTGFWLFSPVAGPERVMELPAFPNAARAQAMFLEEMQLAVLGRKTPKEAVAAIVERITPLMTA